MADTYIKYNDHSISSAFKDHYIVPDYQREYVWTDEQVEQLMADLLDAYNTDNKKAYKQSKFYLTSSLSELVNQGHDTAINRTNSLLFAWSDWNKRSIEERQEMLYRLSEMIWEMS